MMGLLPDDTILVSGIGSKKRPLTKPGTRPSLVKFNRITGNRVCNVLSKYTDIPVGMAVFTSVSGEGRLALSYGLETFYFWVITARARSTTGGHTHLPKCVSVRGGGGAGGNRLPWPLVPGLFPWGRRGVP